MAAKSPPAIAPSRCWTALLLFAASAQAQRVSPQAIDVSSAEPWTVTVRNVTVTNPGSTSLSVQVSVQYSSPAASSRRLADDASDIAPIGTPPDAGNCPSVHRLLIKMSEEGSAGRRLQSDATLGIKAWQELTNVGIHVAELGCDAAPKAKSILGKLRSQYGDAIEFAELDVPVKTSIAAPNDPFWSQQWGPPRAKVQTAWDRIAALGGTPRRTVVAVIDTGVRYDHEDLSDQIWVNPNEIAGNGVDDDGNGFIDDIYGYDFHNNDADPMDDAGHGTHCAGIVAAKADNGKGVAGTAGRLADVKIMALKFMGANGGGYTSNAIRALDYAIGLGVPISSNSYGGGGAMQSFQSAINRATAQGHLFVVAAGNEATNIDTSSQVFFPCSYTQTLCVAATTSSDTVASYSNTGPNHVQIAAPGSSIYATYVTSTTSYTYLSGTSMATPGVAGAAALIYSNFKQLTGTQISQMIQDSAEKTSWLAGVVSSGGILDVARLEQLAEASSWVQIQGDTGSTGQSLNFTLAPLGSATVRVQMGGRAGLPEGTLSASLNVTSALNRSGVPVPITYRVLGWPVLSAPWAAQQVVGFDFGKVGLGSVSSRTLTFQNSGNGTLYLRLDKLPAPFLTSVADLLAVGPNSTGSIALACAPNSSSNASASVGLRTSSGLSPYQGVWPNATSLGTSYTLQLTCTGQEAPDLAVWPVSGASVLNADGSTQFLPPSVGAPWEANLSGTGTVAPLVLPSAANMAGCSAHNALVVASKIVLVTKGTCDLLTKALTAQAAGAAGILITDDTDATATTPAAALPAGSATPTIPAFLVYLSVGQSLATRLAAGDQLTVQLSWAPLAVAVGGAGTVSITNRGKGSLKWSATPQVAAGADLYKASLPTAASPVPFEWATFTSADAVSSFRSGTDDSGYFLTVPAAMGKVPFYGQLYSVVMISSNGLLTFGKSSYAADNEGSLPDPAAPFGGIIAPFWTDLICNTSTKVYAGVQTVNGSKALIVQYQNISYYDFNTAPTYMSSETSSFEVRIYETGRIVMSYLKYTAASVASNKVKVGLQSPAGQGFNIQGKLNFSTGMPFSVAFEPVLSPTGATSGTLAPNQSGSYNFTLRAGDRQGYVLVNATDSISGFWTASRLVRVAPASGAAPNTSVPTTTAAPSTSAPQTSTPMPVTATSTTTTTITVPAVTGTATATATITKTETRTASVTMTATATATATMTPTATITKSETGTMTPTATPTSTTRSETRTATVTWTATATATITKSETRTATATETATGTVTATMTPTSTPTSTTRSETRTATVTGTATATATITKSETRTATVTRTATATKTLTATSTTSATRTETTTATVTRTATATATATRTPTATATVTKSETRTATTSTTTSQTQTRTTTVTGTATRTTTTATSTSKTDTSTTRTTTTATSTSKTDTSTTRTTTTVTSTSKTGTSTTRSTTTRKARRLSDEAHGLAEFVGQAPEELSAPPLSGLPVPALVAVAAAAALISTKRCSRQKPASKSKVISAEDDAGDAAPPLVQAVVS